MRKTKITTFVLTIISTIITVTFFIHKNKSFKNKNIKFFKKVTNTSDVKIKSFQLQQASTNNTAKWVLKAKTGKIFRSKNKAECNNSTAILTHKNIKIATLCAPKTNFYLKDNKIEMSGGIKSEILNNSTGNNSIN